VLANKAPRAGRMALSPMLNTRGKLIGDFTVANAGNNRYYVFGSGVAEQYHLRWLEQRVPESGVTLRSLRTELLGFAIAGPKSRDLMARVCDIDVSNAAFPFLGFRETTIGMVPAKVGRISFTGELGYEIWVTADYQLALHDTLVAAGADFGLMHFGSRALNSLRLEKSFGNWAREFRPVYSPVESGLERFVNTDKGDFVGRDAYLRDRESGGVRRLVTFVVDAAEADAIGDEPVWHDDKVVGWITSGGYGHTTGKSIALGYVPKDIAAAGTGQFEIELLGERRSALLVREALYDSQGARMRG